MQQSLMFSPEASYTLKNAVKFWSNMVKPNVKC